MTAGFSTRDPESWNLLELRAPAFVAGMELADLADQDDRIVVLTADLAFSNRTHDFVERHPKRFVNVGIAEQNMISMAAGLATCGLIPYAATFASFVGLLCAEQIRTDIAYPGLPVRILAHHSGMALGFYGTSHHALEDIGIMKSIAGLAVVSATDEHMLRAILRFSIGYPGPIYIRMGRGRDTEVYTAPPTFHLGCSFCVREGGDVAVLATGAEVAPAVSAADLLLEEGINARVIDMASLVPLDRDVVIDAAHECPLVVTVEEHNVTGGLGSSVADVLAEEGIAVRFVKHGIQDVYPLVGPPAALYAHYRLDGAGLAEVIKERLSASRP